VKISGGMSTDSLKSGWFLPTTLSGGSIPFLGVPSSGVWGLLVPLGASDSSYSGDEMAGGHLPRPGRSEVTMYVDDFDILLLVPLKSCVQSSGRRPASSSMVLRPPAARMTGRMTVQGLRCNFFLLGCLCKSWNVISMKYI
jgi:hypothetical protein